MIKERYKVSFNMDEASQADVFECALCAFNVNKGDEVIVCVARNCDVLDHVETQAIDKTIGTKSRELNISEFVGLYLLESPEGESTWDYAKRKNIILSDEITKWLQSQGA